MFCCTQGLCALMNGVFLTSVLTIPRKNAVVVNVSKFSTHGRSCVY